MFDTLDNFEPVAKIAVLGIGGAGCNAVNRMIEENIIGVEFYVLNTDEQSLALSKCANRIILGKNSTGGLGAGGDPIIGRKAAEESMEEIKAIIEGKDMVFIACGEGGGTGTGAAPLIAKTAKDMGILTIGIVTRPFGFEGQNKSKTAIEGINELYKCIDSLIIVSNDKLMMYEGQNTVNNAFAVADSVLARSVKTVTDIIITPYLLNLDFADVRKVLKDSGVALIGYGQGSGENKAIEAAESAVSCPLVEVGISGARRSLCGITYGSKVTMIEINQCIQKINQLAANDLDIKFALSYNAELEDDILISLIASDFKNNEEILKGEKKQTDMFDMLNQTDTNTENTEEQIVKPSDESDIIPNFLKDDSDDYYKL